jgi:hypothetical protein
VCSKGVLFFAFDFFEFFLENSSWGESPSLNPKIPFGGFRNMGLLIIKKISF